MKVEEFHRYYPKRWQLMLGATALIALLLTVWAGIAAVNSENSLELARAGLSAGVLAALLTLAFRLRPRANWGIRMSPALLTIARPLEGQIEIVWTDIRESHRAGSKRNVLLLTLNDARHIAVPEYLFASHAEFESVVTAIEERLPQLPFN